MTKKLPGSPYTLDDYEDVVPGISERIIVLVEQESSHRQMIDCRRQLFTSTLELAGLSFVLFMAGYITASSLLAFADYLTLVDQGGGLRFYVF